MSQLYHMKEFRIKQAENSFFYRLAGKGRRVILLHGFSEDGSIWNELGLRIQNSFQFIIPDLPGSGLSDPILDMSLEGLADWLYLFIQEIEGKGEDFATGSESISLIGHSMGGYISLAFAEKYPEKLNALGLFHSSAFADTEEKKASRRKSIRFIREHGSRPFIEQTLPNLFSGEFRIKFPETVKQLIQRFSNFSSDVLVQYSEAMIARPERTRILENIRVPVLVIGGAQDNAVPLSLSLAQGHLAPLSYLLILKHSGHMGMLEEPVLSGQFLEKFLQEIEMASP